MTDSRVLELIGGRNLTAELGAGLAPAVGLSIAEQEVGIVSDDVVVDSTNTWVVEL